MLPPLQAVLALTSGASKNESKFYRSHVKKKKKKEKHLHFKALRFL